MTATAAKTVKDQKLVAFGLVESASVNSITDYTSSLSNESKVTTENEKENFANIFICHLIFYAVFCISLVLHIFIDLGLGSFIKKNVLLLKGHGKKSFFEKIPAFA